MQDPFFRFGRFNLGSSDISGFGGGQQATRVIRRVYVSNDSPTQVSTLDPFQTSFLPSIFPTMEPSMTMITHHRYSSDGFPSKEEPVPEETRRSYFSDEYHKPPPKANPTMIPGGYYGNDFSNYPPRHDPRGGNPINLHLNLHLRPQDSGYPGYGNYNGQNGGGPYNPQVQGGNGVGGSGDITLGPKINGANLNIGDGKAGGGDVGGEDKKKKKKKKKKDNDSSNHDGQQAAKKDNDSSDQDGQAK